MSKHSIAMTSFTLLLCTYALPAASEKKIECDTINCDCASLPSESWKSMCSTKQQYLRENCEKVASADLGYCSIHGPAANRIPIKLDLSQTTQEQSNSVKLLNYKFAAVFWSLYKDLDFIEKAVEEQQYAMAEERLQILQANTENLFGIQKNMVRLLLESKNTAETEKSWRNYSEDTNAVTVLLEESADKLLASNKDKRSRELAINMMETSADLYEQVGYAYSQGIRHKLSAQAWKKSADIASLLISMTETSDHPESADLYRYQAATRLHRASYNWSLSIDDQNALSALEKAQTFLDDKDDTAPLLRQGSVVSN